MIYEFKSYDLFAVPFCTPLSQSICQANYLGMNTLSASSCAPLCCSHIRILPLKVSSLKKYLCVSISNFCLYMSSSSSIAIVSFIIILRIFTSQEVEAYYSSSNEDGALMS